MNNNVVLSLYIKRENFNNKNIKIIKETIKSKIKYFGVLYGELLEKIEYRHFETSLMNVSHIIKSIDPLKSNVDLKILSTRKGLLLSNMYFETNLYAIVRDSYTIGNGYLFHTIDIVDYIPEGYIPLSCLRKEKIKRLLK